MKFILCAFVIFMSGVNVAINLTRLIDTSPLYEAAWWKVGLSVIIAIAFVFYAKKEAL